jgi:hypothetical protein
MSVLNQPNLILINNNDSLPREALTHKRLKKGMIFIQNLKRVYVLIAISDWFKSDSSGELRYVIKVKDIGNNPYKKDLNDYIMEYFEDYREIYTILPKDYVWKL